MIKYKNSKVYLVDFFDTIMFRTIHPFQLLNYWADNIKKKFDLTISSNELLKIRKDCFSKLTTQEIKNYYFSAISNMYKQLCFKESGLKLKVKNEEFINYCKELECSLEYAVQYPNKKLINELKKAKLNGAKIYIVSDFHLGKEELKSFLEVQNIDFTLFDKIFVSSDCGAEKANGTLYKYVMDYLKLSPNQAIMIGDSFNSDKKQAKKNGLKTIYRMRFLHKVYIHLRMRYIQDNSNYICKKFIKYCYKYRQPFSEYVVLFHSFIERLYDMNNGNKLTFLSREGWFYKRLFESYIFLHCTKDNIPETSYFLCSRMAITSVQLEKIEQNGRTNKYMNVHDYLLSAGILDEKEIIEKYNLKSDTPISEEIIDLLHSDIKKQVSLNKKAFSKYSSNFFTSKDKNNIVDVGYKGTMQIGLENILNKKLIGLYLGIDSDNDSNFPIEKYGLLFSDKTTEFSYNSILRTNRQLYELLSAAPHGGVQTYIMNDDTSEVKVPLFWADNEKNLYKNIVENWQKVAEKLFSGYTLYSKHEIKNRADRRNAKIVFKSAFFADNNRLSFLREMDKGFFWNFTNQSAGIKYNPKSVKINFSLIYAPENYVRFFAKVQRILPDNKIIQLIYRFFAHIYYAYTFFVMSIKNIIYLISKGKQQ